jgi:hypothetical protein
MLTSKEYKYYTSIMSGGCLKVIHKMHTNGTNTILSFIQPVSFIVEIIGVHLLPIGTNIPRGTTIIHNRGTARGLDKY